MLRLFPIFTALFLAACAHAPVGEMPERREQPEGARLPPMATFSAGAASAPRRSNASIARDFLDLSFEMESGRAIPVLSRFEGPITVAVAPGAPATLTRDLDQLLARLRTEAQINITRIPHASPAASITVEAIPRARMQRAVPQAACFVVPRVSSWAEFRAARRTALLDWTTLTTREHATVFVPNDVSPQEVRDCLHEEIGQALGPLNDLYRLSDSIFNDDNFHAVLTGFDMTILRAYYDPALQSGMSRAQVASRLPAILARINPRGGSGSAPPLRPDREWITAIETALGGNAGTERRISAARRAVAIAERRGWQDVRLGFSYFALGRIALPRDPELAISSFVTAGRLFQALDPGGIHEAHVNMQLAAVALSTGNPQQTLQLVAASQGAATQAQNAALLATLLMLRAEALEELGRASEARAVRLDSLAWARYGFGTPRDVRARLSEVAALPPQTRS